MYESLRVSVSGAARSVSIDHLESTLDVDGLLILIAASP